MRLSHKLLIINSSMNGVRYMDFTPSFFFAHHLFSMTYPMQSLKSCTVNKK